MKHFQGEFVAERDKRLKYISGFSGPVGLAVITKTKAAFWTDSDYSEQAERELDCNWILLRLGEPGEPSPTEWLKSELKPGYRVGANPKLIPFEMWEAWNKDLSMALMFPTKEPFCDFNPFFLGRHGEDRSRRNVQRFDRRDLDHREAALRDPLGFRFVSGTFRYEDLFC